MLQNLKYTFLVLLFIFSVSFVSAQNPVVTAPKDTAKTAWQSDSGKTKTPLRVDYISDPLHSQHFQSIDTSLNGWQLTKPVYSEGLGRTFLSDAFTASRNLTFDDKDFTNPVFLPDPFKIYQYDPASIKFYHGTRRFTELNYIQGHDQDQQVQINYGQLLSKRLFGGFDYLRAASLGYFDRQVSSVSDLDLWFSYHTKNFRYRVFADAIWTRDESQESGGIKNFNDNQQAQTLQTNLSLSENRTRSRYFNIVQSWSPSFLSHSPVDTTEHHFNTYTHFLPVRFFLSTSYTRNTYTYSDQALTDSFYTHFYTDSISTQDSITSDLFTNKFGIQGNIGHVKDSLHHQNYFEAAIINDAYIFREGDANLVYPQIENKFDNVSVAASIRNDSSDLFWKADASYFLNGRNKDDHSANGLLGYHLNKVLAADVHAGDDLSKPSLLEDEYYSNNFMWNNDFLKKEMKKTGATLSSIKYKFAITADYILLNNFIYFGDLALPAQIDQQKLTSLKLNDEIRWRRWHLLTKIIYQKTNGTDVLRLPQWQTYNSVYYEHHFFKSALFAQLGIDVRYVSAYYGDAYMPATRVFYLQDSSKVGGFSNIDAFVNMRIRSARIYVKFENVAGFLNKGVSYYVPGYPVTPFAVRVGISMRFFDL